jgi:molybdate transport system substrate-binding protein
LLALAALLPWRWAAAQEAPPLRVLGTGAVEHPVHDLIPGFTRATGRRVMQATGNAGAVAARIRAGEAADLVLNSAAQIEAMAREGLVWGESRAELGRMRIGLAVREGAPAPDIATPEALRAALLAAPVLAYSDGSRGATTGIHLDRLFASWGIAEALRPRSLLFQQGLAAVQAVAEGRAALVMTQISEIVAVPGVTLVGPLPEAVNLVTPYLGAVATRAADPAGAAALLQYLTGPEGAARFRAAGFAVGG